MSDNTSIPILLDGDTGYGNFNNARRLIRKLEQRGVAGVCIEDKLFPKTNSLLEGVSQPLADIDEFCGKIMACKDAQKDDAFSGTHISLPAPHDLIRFIICALARDEG
jgi:phosphoenolpyruvate phosphomutase